MYIPLSFMGGTGVVASCVCNQLEFQLTILPGQYMDLTYQPCNGEQITTVRYTTSIIVSDGSICVGDNNYNFSGTGKVEFADFNLPCLQANCQSCSCYEYFYQTNINVSDTYIRYIPCNVPSSSLVTIGPLAAGVSGSFICSFPWTVRTISGSLGNAGVVTQVNSGSCQSIASGSLKVGDLRGGGIVLYATGSYPNQYGLIVTTQSVATSSADMNRWGFYGTVTGINNRAYGAGASNTAALRNYIPATGSIAANAITASINGYNDWFLPSAVEALSSSLNNITWPNVEWYTSPTEQPLFRNLLRIPGTQSDRAMKTSTEKYDGTTGERQIYNRVVKVSGIEFDQDKNTSVVVGAPSQPQETSFWGYRYFTSSLVP
jgi:hypothetical protein